MNPIYKKTTIVLLLIGSLAGCDGEGTLLELYPWQPIVNPEIRTLIQDNRIIHAQFVGRNHISGITANGNFETPDQFKSFDFEPFAWQEEGLLDFGADLIVRAVPDKSSISLIYSRDNGRTWNRYGHPIVDEGGLALGKISPVKLVVGAERLMWLLCQQGTGAESRLLLYRVNLAGGTHETLLRRRNALAVTAAAFDGQRGWVLWKNPLIDSDSVHLLKTIDGGSTWSEGATLENISDPLFCVIDDGDLLVFGQAGAAFHSADGGATFQSVVTGMGPIQRCQAATADVIYVLSVDGRLGKSVDGGFTWDVLGAQAGNTQVSGSKMYFQNEQRGIVYDIDRMFITEDGGEHWEVLIYPYNYVFE